MTVAFRSLVFAFAMAFPLLATSADAQEAPAPRLALVIGNADYNLDGTNATPQALSDIGGFASDLGKPINDVDDVETALKRLNFDVMSLRNADRAQMMSTIAAFGIKVGEAGPRAVVIVYYSGHAMQVDGLNLLIPAGAKLPGGFDFRRMGTGAKQEILRGPTVPLPFILEQLNDPDEGGLNIIILDSCRNNWWDSQITGAPRGPRSGTGMSSTVSTSRGAAERHFDLGSTVIAFSTQPGNVADDGGQGARNSPYTKALRANLERNGISVTEMLNDTARDVERETREWQLPQRPWMNQAPLPKVCLVGCVGEREAELARQLAEAQRRTQVLEASGPPRSAPLRAARPLFRRITDQDVVSIAKYPNPDFVPGVVSGLNSYAALYGVDTPQRMAHFFSQMAHECDNFRTMQEYASGDAYEGRAALGNTEPGDGRRYKGRGIIQITGRALYRKMGEAIGIDLENQPELAADPGIAVRIALHWWSQQNQGGVSLNDLADRDDVEAITRRINGGLNGLADRQMKLAIAKSIFTVVPSAAAPPSP